MERWSPFQWIKYDKVPLPLPLFMHKSIKRGGNSSSSFPACFPGPSHGSKLPEENFEGRTPLEMAEELKSVVSLRGRIYSTFSFVALKLSRYIWFIPCGISMDWHVKKQKIVYMEQHPRGKGHQNAGPPQGSSCPFPRLSISDANRGSRNVVQNAPLCLIQWKAV